MSSSSYFRYPHLHGELVTFVAEDDVWAAPLSGGRAWRISAMQLPARNPRFSPDGTTIAWTVVQGSAPEVVAADVDGGGFRQLTYWGSATTKVKGFTTGGDVLATSSYQREESRHTWAHAVPLDGSAAHVLPYGPVDSVAYGPASGGDRAVVVSTVLSREPAWWKRYRGGTAGKLWLDADGSGRFQRLAADLSGSLADPMWIAGRIVFLSDHEGYGNVYSIDPDGSDLRRHTDHDDFYARHASSDGSRIVYESAGSLWLLDGLDAEPRPLAISLGSASTARRQQPLKVASHLGEVVPETSGRASVVESHGTLHWLTHRDGPSRVLEAQPGVRGRLARPLGEGRVLYAADHGGEEALYIKDVHSSPVPGMNASEQGGAAGQTGTVRIDLPQRTRVSAIAASPDGERAAIATEFGEVLMLQTLSGELRSISTTVHGAIDDICFAPDSAWIGWAEPVTGEGARCKIRIARIAGTPSADGDSTGDEAAGANIIDVTDGRFNDHSPAFTPDGTFIAFLSERSFDPVYDTHRFDLSFPSSTKPFLVALSARTPSPFGPSADGAAASGDERSGRDGPVAGDETEAAGSADNAVAVEVDVEHLADRVIAVPVPQGSYDSLSAVDGALLWLANDIYGVTGEGRASVTDQDPGRRLERFDIAKRDVTVLVPAVERYRVTGDGKQLVMVNDQKVRVLPTGYKTEEDAAENISVDLGRIRVHLDPVRVWGQAFDEAWRLQRDFYWAPDMAGIDWQQIHDQYRPLVAKLGSHDDLVDVLWEMHGELGTSHAYVMPAPVTEPGAGRQGLLGVDVKQHRHGWEITRILPGDSSDPLARSPLTAPGAAARIGDIITAVDGLPAANGAGLGSLLAGAAGKTVELTILDGPSHGEAAGVERRIAVVPVADEERLRYQHWVSGNRRVVREASGGRFGYLHIPDMVARGWSQLHRDLDNEAAQDALVIDVRSNRGGHTSQLVAELIGRKVAAWNLPRGEQPHTYPAHAPRGPIVVLADEFSGSDGDIITQIAKLRSIGPVIGTRTWGGVIGIDGRFKLADGTGVTQPRYAFWFSGSVGWSVENYGVDPDIEVEFPPHAHGAGEDPQLEHGVGVLTEMLREQGTDEPPQRAGYPSRRPGPLPPRPQG
ncbi:S41 family peptidase [Arthrobacter castelli]|uniref:S41 family peptidase n=1 Tax=Arthrobacter castelli TaxID=271431 RepID=UPI0003F89CC8|nr:S41 family peptidase [Arthrobacter castelli]